MVELICLNPYSNGMMIELQIARKYNLEAEVS